VTRFLELVVPGAVPHVLAVEPDEGWLLLDDIARAEPESTDDSAGEPVLEHIRALARVQLALAGRVALGEVEPLRGERDAVIGLATAYQIVSLGHILRELEPATRYELSDDLHVFLHSLDSRVPH
jgi:hypothetical protein